VTFVSPPVVALVSDLMDRSKVDTAIPGVEFGRTPEACAGAAVVVIDLGKFADHVAAVRRLAPDARVVAFGRHDNPQALAQAKVDGADDALPRSRFFQDPAAAVRGER
jgi:hypothetical protein